MSSSSSLSNSSGVRRPLFSTSPVEFDVVAGLVLKNWNLTLTTLIKASQNHTFNAVARDADTRYIVRVTPLDNNDIHDEKIKELRRIENEVRFVRALREKYGFNEEIPRVIQTVTKPEKFFFSNSSVIILVTSFACGSPVDFASWTWINDHSLLSAWARWTGKLHRASREYRQYVTDTDTDTLSDTHTHNDIHNDNGHENKRNGSHNERIDSQNEKDDNENEKESGLGRLSALSPLDFRDWRSMHDGVLSSVVVSDDDEKLVYDNMHYGLIHGDINISNFFYQKPNGEQLEEEGRLCVFDWDQVQYAWYLYDVTQIVFFPFMLAHATHWMDGKPSPCTMKDVDRITEVVLKAYEEGRRGVSSHSNSSSSGSSSSSSSSTPVEYRVDRLAFQRMLLLRRDFYVRFCTRAIDELSLSASDTGNTGAGAAKQERAGIVLFMKWVLDTFNRNAENNRADS